MTGHVALKSCALGAHFIRFRSVVAAQCRILWHGRCKVERTSVPAFVPRED